MKEAYKHIDKLEIEQSAIKLGAQIHSKGLLFHAPSASDVRKLLNAPFYSQHSSILLVKKGKIKLKVDGTIYVLSANKILCIAPMVVKEFLSVEDEIEYHILLISDDYIDKSPTYHNVRDFLNLRILFSHYYFEVDAHFFNDIVNIFIALNNSLNRNEKYISSSLLVFTLTSMIAEYVQTQNNVIEKDKKTTLVNNFLHLLSQHIDSHRNVTFYADLLHINPQYLSRTVKYKTGKTALNHIIETVIKKAEILLNNPHNSIREVSEKLSFPDPYTFSKYFKQNYGINPSEFRNL